MIRELSIGICLAFVTPAIPLRAANGPHAEADGQTIKVWTNDDLESLQHTGLVSIVGQIDEQKSISELAPQVYDATKDPGWYAEQAARLRDDLERRQTQLREYRQALADAQSLTESTGGINLVGEDFAITPEAAIEILQQRVTQEQSKLDDLEDLARRNDIEPGTLREQ
jgi:hypothetical protein